MSRLLDAAARLDRERSACLSANDEAMKLGGLRAYRVQVKAGAEVRMSFECMSLSSMHAAIQHADLKGEGEYVNVLPLCEVLS